MADRAREWSKFGRYALLDKIGSGGMAEIFRAKTFGAAGFEKEFAIKLILPSLVDDTEFVEMFINEAKIAVSLYHANIVQVFDLGELDEQYYIAMEYVHGKDLLDVLARCAEMGIKIPLNLVLFITMEMLKGLDFAHRAKDPYGDDLNIIHRDVSPSNILISYAGDVKVGDFGVAKAAIQRNLTESGSLKGKVGYMSPEQVMGEAIDARSDVFSACIVFFEALSMSRLFVGNSDLDVMLRVRDVDIAASLAKAGPLPAGLEAIIHRGLARHREERYQTAGEFYQALIDFCFQYGIKVTGSDLSNFMRRLFADEIEREKNLRRSEPGMAAPPRTPARAARPATGSRLERPGTGGARAADGPPAPAPAAVDEAGAAAEGGEREVHYRFRDGSGLIFGPMSQSTLIDLLKVRPAGRDDRISINDGPWITVPDPHDMHESLVGGELTTGYIGDESTLLSSGPASSPSVAQPDGAPEAGPRKVAAHGIVQPARKASAAPDEAPTIQVSDSIVDGIEALSSGTERALFLDASSGELSTPISDAESFDTGSSGAHAAPAIPTSTPTDGKAFQDLKAQYASYEGDLRDASFARIIARLHRARATGRLHVSRNGVEKSIFFRLGEPVLVESNKKEELLGHFLLTRNLITQAQLSEALERLSEWGGRLGDALVAIGAIPAHEIFNLLSSQMREKLLDIFAWEAGHYGYYENQEPNMPGYALDLDTYDMIVEGARERISLERIQEFYRNRTYVPIYLRQPAVVNVDRLKLRAKELRIFHQLTAGDTLRTLLTRFTVEQQKTVYRIVYLLHQTELLAFEVTEKVNLPS